MSEEAKGKKKVKKETPQFQKKQRRKGGIRIVEV